MRCVVGLTFIEATATITCGWPQSREVSWLLRLSNYNSRDEFK